MSGFTLAQKKAHDPRRHLSITANAGSGKTRVLVSRYCDLVEYFGSSPDRIAAITFTEKAATELRGKIARELETRLSDEAHKGNWPLLKRARERFTSAIVTTIHGFCSQLLREFPIECDVSPSFSVVSGYERSQLVEESLMEAIETALGSGADENAPPTLPYLTARRIGRERMESILRMMLAKREAITFSERSGVLAAERERTLELWETSVAGLLRGLLLNATTVPAIVRLIDHMKEGPADEARGALARAQMAREAQELLAAFDTLRSILLTADGKIRQRSYDLKKDEQWILAEPAATVASTAKRAEPFLTARLDRDIHRTLLDDTRILLDVYRDAVARYERRKSRLSALDFDDLQLRLLGALSNEDVRKKIEGRFDHVMVDEFQDTNELQYAIVYELLDRLRQGRLCIVGDQKQSIYGFRNAEVKVFDDATRDIEKQNREQGNNVEPLEFRNERIEPETRDEELGVIRLDASFRLLPSICAFVNDSCAPTMRSSGVTAFGIDYEPLVCARRSAGRGTMEFILATPEPEQADVDPAREEGNEQCDIDWCPESEMLARRLLKIVAEGETVVWEQVEGEERPRAATFSDIAILCRKRSHFAALEQAFRKYGIPFVAHGSVGFYKTQEIYDIANYLRTLINARDDMALLGVLRSPLFCVSDAELYRLGADPAPRRGSGLWERAARHVESRTAEPALVRAVATITEDRAMAGRIPIQLVIRRVLERTGWRGAVAGSERGEQVLANVDKLLEMARDFDGRGLTDIFDFVDRLTDLIESEEVEAEAPVNTGRDAVRVMTMHASKGLEFPIVALPFLHSTIRISGAPFFDKELGFGWNWSFNREEFRPAVVALMSLREGERCRSEEARLFYVSATRARDMLILSGEYDPEKPPRGTMLDWALCPFEEVPADNISVTLTTERLEFLEADGITRRTTAWEQSIAFHRTIEDLPKHAPNAGERLPFQPELVRIGELPARAEGEIYSATQLLVYNQCPTRYYLRYRLGLPEDLATAYGDGTDDRDSDEGLTFARLFRIAAKRLDEMALEPIDAEPAIGPDGARAVIAPELWARVVDETVALEPIPAEQAAVLRTRLAETFERLLASGRARAVLFPEEARTSAEHELRMPFDRDYLLGVADRLTIDDRGTVSILHFKTLRLPADRLAETSRRYLPQLRLYAYLASLLNPRQGSITITLLYTEHPDRPQEFVFTRFDLVRIEEELRAAIADIRAISYTGRRELPLRTDHCPECPYWIGERCLLARAGGKEL